MVVDFFQDGGQDAAMNEVEERNSTDQLCSPGSWLVFQTTTSAPHPHRDPHHELTAAY